MTDAREDPAFSRASQRLEARDMLMTRKTQAGARRSASSNTMRLLNLRFHQHAPDRYSNSSRPSRCFASRRSPRRQRLLLPPRSVSSSSSGEGS